MKFETLEAAKTAKKEQKMAFQNLTKKEWFERVGHMGQIAGAKRYIMQEGKKDNVKAVDIWNGSGLAFTVICDRASDLSSMTYKGRSLCWLSNLNVSSPYYKRPGDYEWNNNFSGGMFATCGMNTAGVPCKDQDEKLELHGPISNLPSEEVSCQTYWEGDDYWISYTAKIYQARPFGENLCLTRNIRVKMGENIVRVHDQVENLGFVKSPFMIVYHINFGYPLLDEGTKLYLTYDKRFPTSEWAAESEDKIGVITRPDDGYKARAYNHTMRADENGFAYAAIVNEKLGLGTTIKFDARQLDQLNLWKCLQKSNYVLGLEPCNCRTWGRDREREENHLVYLEPFEQKELYFEIQIHDGPYEIAQAVKRYNGSL